jgi:serine/threonine protein kinase
MLVFDPNLRINANEALHHNYFNEYRRQYLFSGLNHFSMNHDNPSSATNARIHPSETEGTFQAQTQLSSGEHPTNNADYKSSLSSISTLSSSEDQLSSNSISPSFSSVHAFPR